MMKVSVLLPFLNAAGTLELAVTSVMEQDYDDFELILVNNGSDDGSEHLARQLCNSYPGIRLIDESRKGIARALNTGLDHCSGKYIARMDADDISLPGRIKNQAEYLDHHPEAGLVSGLINFNSSIQNHEGMSSYVSFLNSLTDRHEIFNHRFVESPFAHPSVMFRAELISQYGKYSEDLIPEDYELWLRWFQNGVHMDKLSVPVLNWSDHAERASRKMPNYSDDAFAMIRMHYLSEFLKKSLNPARQLLIWGGGKLSKRKVIALEEKGVRVDGFIDVDPERRISGYSVLHYLNIPPPDQCFIVSLVSNRGRYREIAAYLLERNYKIGEDFLPAS